MRTVNIVLIVLLALQLVILMVRPTASVHRAADTVALYPGLDAASVNAVEISSGKDAKEKVTLVRKDKEWVIQERSGYAADTARVEEILALLPQLARAEVVSTRPEMFASYDLADTSSYTRLRLLDKEGRALVDLMAGKGMVRSSFVRKFGENRVYRVDASLAGKLMTRPRDFFADTRLALPETTARKALVVEYDGDAMEFRKTGGGEPAPPQYDHEGNPVPIVKPDRWELVSVEGSGTADATAVDNYVSGLGSVYFEDVAAAAPTAEHQLEKPFLRIRFVAEKEEAVLKLGAPVDPAKPDGARFLQVEGKPWVYTVDSFTWKRWAKKRAEFLAKPSTGEAGALPEEGMAPELNVPGLPNPAAPMGILPEPPMMEAPAPAPMVPAAPAPAMNPPAMTP